MVLGLEDSVGLSNCAPRRTDQGWAFAPEDDYADDLHGAAALHDLYRRSDPGYSGRVTTPVLWDRARGRIVSNESADILRMMSTQMAHLGNGLDLYPVRLRGEIDAASAAIHAELNNGVYRAGFAETQAAYEEAAHGVFRRLDALERDLAARAAVLGLDGTDPEAPGPFLHGAELTETDLRLFPTLARFDVAYHSAFRCNLRRLTDYPHLWAYARRLHRLPGVERTVDLAIYRRAITRPRPSGTRWASCPSDQRSTGRPEGASGGLRARPVQAGDDGEHDASQAGEVVAQPRCHLERAVHRCRKARELQRVTILRKLPFAFGPTQAVIERGLLGGEGLRHAAANASRAQLASVEGEHQQAAALRVLGCQHVHQHAERPFRGLRPPQLARPPMTSLGGGSSGGVGRRLAQGA